MKHIIITIIIVVAVLIGVGLGSGGPEPGGDGACCLVDGNCTFTSAGTCAFLAQNALLRLPTAALSAALLG